MIHHLKTDPEVFDAVRDGRKTFEIRKNDRGFAIGDTLCLKKTKHTGAQMAKGASLVYTGDEEARIVTHLLLGGIYGLAPEWVILSLSNSEQTGA